MENQVNVSTPQFGGPWTEQKLEILRRYLDAYTTALKDQRFKLTYVDAFAGAGSYAYPPSDYEEFYEMHRGSAQIALDTGNKPFDHFVFIEKDAERVQVLRELAREHSDRDILIVEGDANLEIPNFCKGMSESDRAVVFLDPYATEVSWMTIEEVAKTKKIDCWTLFPLMAVSRMMPTDKEPNEATANRLDRIFGGHAYWQQHYRDSPQLSMFDDVPKRERPSGSQPIADLYRERLTGVFHSVAPTSRTLRNSKNAPLFELIFAASNPRGAGIAMRISSHILKNW